jgi:peptidoglycan/LPS O-acetylase OafA/YrhL
MTATPALGGAPTPSPAAELHAGRRGRLPEGRNLRFDRLRILFATLVLLAHAPELTDGGSSRELFSRLTRTQLTFGDIGVDGFFLLSGFLIVRSWQSDPNLLNFLRKRVLRIVTGYLVAAILSILVMGIFAPATPHFFAEYAPKDLKSILLLSAPATPAILSGMYFPVANGSLWSIGYEFRCYLLVALFGICGFFRRPWIWLVAMCLFAALALNPVYHQGHTWHLLYTAFGEPYRIFRLVAVYFVGSAFYLFRRSIPFRWPIAIAAVTLLIPALFNDWTVRPALVILGGYLLFYYGQLKRPVFWPHPFPDISYGIYLYGWPVESLWIYFHHGSPWVTFAVAVLISFPVGWLSWHFVERPMLRLKRRASAALPPP